MARARARKEETFAERVLSRVEKLEEQHAANVQELYDARVALQEAGDEDEEAVARLARAEEAMKEPDMPHDHTLVRALYETLREEQR